MNNSLDKKEANLLLQQALAEPLGLLCWAEDPIDFAQKLYSARREDPTLHSIKILNTPEGVALCHEPYDPNYDEFNDDELES